MPFAPSRRALLATAALLTVGTALPAVAQDLGASQALVNSLVDEVNGGIASDQGEDAMSGQFAQIFMAYTDSPTIARYSPGTDARSASADQFDRCTRASSNYVARRYGGRFREFIGGQIVVEDACAVPNGVEVITTAAFRNESPLRVDFWVLDATGQPRIFNIIIEGINMNLSERTEVRAMLDQRGGDIERLIADLDAL